MDKELLEKVKTDLETKNIKSIIILEGGVYSLIWKGRDGSLDRIRSAGGMAHGEKQSSQN